MVVDKFGRDTGEIVARDGFYTLNLPPTDNNTDPRDLSAYLVGGDPRMLVEKVTSLPKEADAFIQVVWPHDGAANVTAVLLQPGTRAAIPCRWLPNVRVWASADGAPAVLLGSGTKRLLTQDGATFAVWDFNNVPLSRSARSVDFWLDVEGVTTHATRWTYVANPDPETDPPQTWQQAPNISCT